MLAHQAVLMTNPEIIAAIERWQTDPRVYPLTCCTSREVHTPLKPIERAGQIILVCPDCGHRELQIPEAILEWTGDLSGFLGIAR
jgi:hypothetical protein